MLQNCGTSKALAMRSSSATESGASTNSPSAPALTYRACVGACDQEGILVSARGGGSAHLALHDIGRNDVLARHMTAALGRHLVLDEDGGGAHLLIGLDRARHVLDVAIAVIGVDQHGQR
jgi:hypothetical protein